MRPSDFFWTTLFILLALGVGLGVGIPLDWHQWNQPESATHRILFQLRLPRVIFVFAAGSALAVVGATYQILFHNVLAEPYLLGISSASVLGMAVAESFLGITAATVPSQAIGLGCAAVVTGLLVWMAKSDGGMETQRIALFGVGVNFFLSSLLFLLLSFQSQTVGGGTLRWLFGQIPWLSNAQALQFTAVTLAVLALLFYRARALDALGFGDGVARTLGFSPERNRIFFLVLTSALVAWLVSFTGSIGFVGLVVPHLVRLLFTPGSARGLLGRSALLGGAFLCFADAAARGLLPPMEFPVGIMTTLLGGPIFLALLWKR